MISYITQDQEDAHNLAKMGGGANTTMKDAHNMHGTNPQYLVRYPPCELRIASLMRLPALLRLALRPGAEKSGVRCMPARMSACVAWAWSPACLLPHAATHATHLHATGAFRLW